MQYSPQRKRAFSDPVLLSGMLGHPLYACSEDGVMTLMILDPKTKYANATAPKGNCQIRYLSSVCISIVRISVLHLKIVFFLSS